MQVEKMELYARKRNGEGWVEETVNIYIRKKEMGPVLAIGIKRKIRKEKRESEMLLGFSIGSEEEDYEGNGRRELSS